MDDDTFETEPILLLDEPILDASDLIEEELDVAEFDGGREPLPIELLLAIDGNPDSTLEVEYPG